MRRCAPGLAGRRFLAPLARASRGASHLLHRRLLLAPVLAVFASMAGAQPTGEPPGALGDAPTLDATTLARLRETMTPLAFTRIDEASTALEAYLDYYGLQIPSVEHHVGTFRSAGHVIATHAFVPPEPRGTVMVLHGLFDHTGTLALAIGHLVRAGFAVAAYDQPGHGLSSGRRASIEDFSIYGEVLDTFLELVRQHMPAPVHALAHSTGAAVLVTRLLRREDPDIERVVLVAPLVRSAHWETSTLGGRFLNLFVDDVPRVFRDNTSDEDFQDFVRADPLQARRASLDWLMALVEWNERIATYPPSPRPIVIVQGDDDDVVDWEYNLAFLTERFPRARVEIIAGGKHQLLGETRALRERTMRIIDDALAAPAAAVSSAAGGD